MSGSKLDDLELPSAGLSYDWFQLEGLAERGATGRLVIAPGVLTRPDLDFNWDVVATAMQHMGARPGVDKLQDEVDLFFQRSRQKGKKPVISVAPKPGEFGRQARSKDMLEDEDGCEEVGYDEEGGESETGTEDGEVPVMPVPSPAAPDKKFDIGSVYASGDVTNQETQVLDDSLLDKVAADMSKEVDAKEKAAAAAHVYDDKAPERFAQKRLRSATMELQPSKVPRTSSVPIKKEPVPVKKEPVPIKDGRSGTVSTVEPLEPQGPEPLEPQGPSMQHGADSDRPDDAQGPQDAPHDEMARPALLATAGVVSPSDQLQLTKPKGGKKDKKPKKTSPKKATKEAEAEAEIEPKRKPGRPKKIDSQPKAKATAKAKAKARAAKPKTPQKKSSTKRKASDEVGSSQDTKFYSPD
ncbi:unnamed protein product, partial [Symbiodinium sp. KB8]